MSKEMTELELLRAENARLKSDADSGNRYLKEIQELKRKKGKGLNEIQTKEIFDVKYISLWHISGHNVGKRVGPIHPDLAEDTFIMFSNKGIKLSIHKPTESFIEEYKNTQEYKDAAEKERLRRKGKAESFKDKTIEKMTKAFAKAQGLDPSAMESNILRPQSVRAKK